MHVPDPRTRPALRGATLAFALSAPLGPAAIAGDDPPAAPAFEEISPVRVSTLPWFRVPRRSRAVLRKMASRDGVTLSKCVAYEAEGQIRYEFHAWRRTGLFSREDIVLTEFTETVEQAREREESQSLRSRLSDLSKSISPR